MELLKEVLAAVKPTKEEERAFFNKINSVINKINKNLKNAKAVLGGSGAKGTWIKGDYDVDVFVKFDFNKFKDKDISKELLRSLKRSFKKITTVHGSRDYYQIKEDSFTFEIVPVLAIKRPSEAQNIMDMSPFHVDWVAKQVRKSSRLADEIRLAKLFCKANSVYGAESYINGFSGYVLEIMMSYYGGFMDLVKAASKWKDRVIIDIQNHYKNKNILFELNKSKLVSPLVVIDPVQKERNASAALSKDKFDKFIDACKRFISNPSRSSFEKKNYDINYLKNKYKNKKIMIITAKSVVGREDVVGTKLFKVYEYIINNLNKNEFKIIETDWNFDRKSSAVMYFVFDPKPLPLVVELEGPPLKVEKHVEAFKKRHKKTFTKAERIFAKERREFTVPEDLIKHLLKDPYIKEKAKEIKLV